MLNNIRLARDKVSASSFSASSGDFSEKVSAISHDSVTDPKTVTRKGSGTRIGS